MRSGGWALLVRVPVEVVKSKSVARPGVPSRPGAGDTDPVDRAPVQRQDAASEKSATTRSSSPTVTATAVVTSPTEISSTADPLPVMAVRSNVAVPSAEGATSTTPSPPVTVRSPASTGAENPSAS